MKEIFAVIGGLSVIIGSILFIIGVRLSRKHLSAIHDNSVVMIKFMGAGLTTCGALMLSAAVW